MSTINQVVDLWLKVRPITRVKTALNKRRAAKGKPLLEIHDETDLLRTSTGGGLAGILSLIIVQTLQAFEATAFLGNSPDFAAGLTITLVYVTTRAWKTPTKIGAI